MVSAFFAGNFRAIVATKMEVVAKGVLDGRLGQGFVHQPFPTTGLSRFVGNVSR